MSKTYKKQTLRDFRKKENIQTKKGNRKGMAKEMKGNNC
jgi:hypothetical protein